MEGSLLERVLPGEDTLQHMNTLAYWESKEVISVLVCARQPGP